MTAGRVLRSEEAARRLGVKLPTLYAYVSRGLLTAQRAPDGRHSLFLADDVEALARRSRGGRRTETRLATVTTATTQLGDDGPRYRGRPATSLATSLPYEDVAELLWQGGDHGGDGWDPAPLRPPAGLVGPDRLTWTVLMAGVADPLRADLRPDAVRSAARRLVATLARSVDAPSRSGPRPEPVLELEGRRCPGSVAGALTARLATAPDADVARAVNAALVLLADHELAASTLAVRVAASTRADLYDAVLAGMAVMGGPLHGSASQLAHGLLRDARRRGPAVALNEALRWQGHVPGFGHTVYRGPDPRFTVLQVLVEDLDRRAAGPGARWSHPAATSATGVAGALAAVVALAAEQGLPAPNVDLGLAALVLSAAMPEDAGRSLFTVARVAGWVAHYLEELEEQPLRYRARAVYAAGD